MIGASPVLVRVLLAATLVIGPATGAGASHVDPAGPGQPAPASFAPAVAQVRPAMISIRSAIRRLRHWPEAGSDRDCRESGGDCQVVPGPADHPSVGAGVIVDAAGLALTSARALARAALLEVGLADGRTVSAAVVGADRRSDVAVLRLDPAAGPYPAARLGASSGLRVGDWVVAIGSPHGLESTVTAGVVSSAPGAGAPPPFDTHLQTDAAGAPGNAGGPLVSVDGEVVGIHSGLVPGLVVPADAVRPIYLALLERGRVPRSWLGTVTQPLTAELARALGVRERRGLLVADLVPGGPGARAGVRPGDVLLQLDGRPAGTAAELERALEALGPGRSAGLVLARGRQRLALRIVTAEEPADELSEITGRRELGTIGLEVRPVTPELGVVVARVRPGGPAALGGLQAGDVVRQVNRRPVRRLADLDWLARPGADAGILLFLVQRGPAGLWVAVTTPR